MTRRRAIALVEPGAIQQGVPALPAGTQTSSLPSDPDRPAEQPATSAALKSGWRACADPQLETPRRQSHAGADGSTAGPVNTHLLRRSKAGVSQHRLTAGNAAEPDGCLTNRPAEESLDVLLVYDSWPRAPQRSPPEQVSHQPDIVFAD